MSIALRLAAIRQRIDTAARTAGRDPATVRLIAISKTFTADAVREAAALGQVEFGENRVQEAVAKMRECAHLPLRWHLVGHLQTNKVRKAVQAFTTIHSVDRIELLEQLDRAAAWAGRSPELLIQVDLAGEATKSGTPPAEVPRLLEAAAACQAVRVVGLMTLPPLPDTPEEARPWFRQLRSIRDAAIASGAPPDMVRELSMGMSGDFEVAIAEGATMVRVGSALFGSRLTDAGP